MAKYILREDSHILDLPFIYPEWDSQNSVVQSGNYIYLKNITDTSTSNFSEFIDSTEYFKRYHKGPDYIYIIIKDLDSSQTGAQNGDHTYISYVKIRYEQFSATYDYSESVDFPSEGQYIQIPIVQIDSRPTAIESNKSIYDHYHTVISSNGTSIQVTNTANHWIGNTLAQTGALQTGTIEWVNIESFDVQIVPTQTSTDHVSSPRYLGLDLSAFTNADFTALGVDPTEDIDIDLDGERFIKEGNKVKGTIPLAVQLSKTTFSDASPIMHAALLGVQGYKIKNTALNNFADIIKVINQIIDRNSDISTNLGNLKSNYTTNLSNLNSQIIETSRDLNYLDDQISDIDNKIDTEVAILDAKITAASNASSGSIGTTSQDQMTLISQMVSSYNLLSNDTITLSNQKTWDEYTIEEKLEILMKMIKVLLSNDNTYDYTIVTSDGEENMSNHDAVVS